MLVQLNGENFIFDLGGFQEKVEEQTCQIVQRRTLLEGVYNCSVFVGGVWWELCRLAVYPMEDCTSCFRLLILCWVIYSLYIYLCNKSPYILSGRINLLILLNEQQ